MKYFLKQEDGFSEVDIRENNGSLIALKNGKSYQIDIIPLDGRRYSIIIDHRSYLVEAALEKNAVRLLMDQQERVIPVLNRRQKMQSEIMGASEKESAEGEIRAPMPGMILRVEAAPGQAVEAGQPLLVIEAMKMENEIRSTLAGTVTEVLVQPQQAVERDDILLVIGD